MTGLSRDNAIVDIQIKGPNDADFMTNGRTTADAFGQWSYTSSVLGQDGTYQVRALSGGQLSDNTVVYTLRSGPSILRTAMYRMGLAGYAGVRDTYISEQTPLLSFSTGVTMSVRSGTAMEPLARFDLSSIPANARVVMAKVGLYSLDAEPCTNVAVPVYQVRAQWDATTNWISPTVGSGWLVPGARSAVSDRVEPATYTQTVRAPFTWYDWDITPMVQQWVSNPSTNHGLIADTALGGQVVKLAVNNLDQPSVTLTMEDLVNALGGRRDFASSEYQELRRRPILFVTYVIP
jgi:hypothetical protein